MYFIFGAFAEVLGTVTSIYVRMDRLMAGLVQHHLFSVSSSSIHGSSLGILFIKSAVEKGSLIKRVSKAFFSPLRSLNTGNYYDNHIEGCRHQGVKSKEEVTMAVGRLLTDRSEASLLEKPVNIIQSINDQAEYNLSHYSRVPGINGAGPNGPPQCAKYQT